MRIVFVIGQLSIGGAERQLVVLARVLAERGHEVTVATFFPGGESGRVLLENPRINWVPVCDSRRQSKAARLLQLIDIPRRLRRLLSEAQPDVVYSMLHLSNFYAWLATRGKRNSQLVWGFRTSNIQLNWERLLPERLCSWLSPTVPLIIANSWVGADYAVSQRGFRPKRFEVIVNGIDTHVFQPKLEPAKHLRTNWGVGSDSLLVGIVGRFDPIKGHDVFLRAAGLVAQRNVNVRFVIVGGGNDHHNQSLQRLADELGVQGKVIWAGPRNDMPAVYTALDVLVSCSHGEGFTNVVGEAMACGTPCIVTNVGDSASIVGGLGRIVQPGDVNSLAREISTYEDWAGEFPAEELRSRIVQNFSVDVLCDKTESAFRKVSSFG
ncbi:glycosyltransferase [Parahaliea mediterranea]|uniref:Glycosyltransferase n=1 Tax=Parahaliea mediterranea TaxID=651086 RepID=A0A939DGR9_9GAMM|nr:glycosyltransferase [Parahaliea mediterranea]MBN7797784.1 glycosyltransferase [Parahaliea mediterranea]